MNVCSCYFQVLELSCALDPSFECFRIANCLLLSEICIFIRHTDLINIVCAQVVMVISMRGSCEQLSVWKVIVH